MSGSAGQSGPQGPKGDTGAAGIQGLKGDKGDVGISELETDGPYPGAAIPPLSGDQGDQSTAKWHAYWPTGDHDLQRSWVQCAPGKVALGGGFGRNDDRSDEVEIVTSAPAQIEDGQLIYSAIDGDGAGSFVPNAWLVEGYNFADQDLIVRPWVICAKVAA